MLGSDRNQFSIGVLLPDHSSSVKYLIRNAKYNTIWY